MDKNEEGAPDALSEDAARGGVTGHYARYVLAFGLAGVIIAFAAIGVYFGYDRLTQTISEALARDPVTVLRESGPYAILIALGAIAAVLLLGLWNMVSGRDENTSQTGMRIRVVLQFIVVCVAMAILYLSLS